MAWSADRLRISPSSWFASWRGCEIGASPCAFVQTTTKCVLDHPPPCVRARGCAGGGRSIGRQRMQPPRSDSHHLASSLRSPCALTPSNRSSLVPLGPESTAKIGGAPSVGVRGVAGSAPPPTSIRSVCCASTLVGELRLDGSILHGCHSCRWQSTWSSRGCGHRAPSPVGASTTPRVVN